MRAKMMAIGLVLTGALFAEESTLHLLTDALHQINEAHAAADRRVLRATAGGPEWVNFVPLYRADVSVLVGRLKVARLNLGELERLYTIFYEEFPNTREGNGKMIEALKQQEAPLDAEIQKWETYLKQFPE